ncbi:MAG: hypothetical protein AAGB46_02245 [Verrucomicrobiota bacterium]
MKRSIEIGKFKSYGFPLLYSAAILFIAYKFATFYNPVVGFAWLPQFGESFEARRTDELRATDYLVTSRYGYDGQYYAQLALSPTLQDEGLEESVDNFNYRARRIFFSWTAYVLGLGNPDWVIQVYSIQNVLFWFLFAGLLWRWFPPKCWQNAARFIGMLFAPGLVVSAKAALLDGPSLCLIALAAYFLEKGRIVAACSLLGASGLGRDSSVLSASMITLPKGWNWREWAAYVSRGIAVIAPLAFWMAYVSSVSSQIGGNTGIGAFNYPFYSWFKGLKENLETLFQSGWKSWNAVYFLMLFTLMLQALYFVFRPAWKSMWWRLGIVNALLMFVLGDAVWEGNLGAVVRVVLPMCLAFNLLVPRSRFGFCLVLVANSLCVFSIVDIGRTISPDPYNRFVESKPYGLNLDLKTRRTFDLEFENEWFNLEWRWKDYWRWTSNDASIKYTVHDSIGYKGRLRFQLRADQSRSVAVSVNGSEAMVVELNLDERSDWLHIDLDLVPGLNDIRFSSDRPADEVEVGSSGDKYFLKFALYNYFLEILPQD